MEKGMNCDIINTGILKWEYWSSKKWGFYLQKKQVVFM